MTPCNGCSYIFYVMMLAFSAAVNGQEYLHVIGKDFLLKECAKKQDVTLVTFVESAESSRADDFDEVVWVFGFSKKEETPHDLIGFAKTGRGFLFNGNEISSPLMNEYVVARKPENKITREGRWKVGVENIYYGAQGGANGYTIDCATAISASEGGGFYVVSQCYPLEKKSAFAKLLKEINLDFLQRLTNLLEIEVQTQDGACSGVAEK
ncbi:hypothetical protein GCM10007860_25130 [Chitiniphilus shinanonensis]|uniref:Lipoprotein n=1 Tax=Chitiniphilus shinanonensis TaxID=553088 RepID=A0ABQ6BUC3_9NEIS|nr:hypothetical protein [Chitiniphilus shinanonensis]GLS05361.1 hypothetical protein GCM10007860_25130 [Chitiniphilus shinanonensis]